MVRLALDLSMDIKKNTFGTLLREARKKNGLSQRAVAERAGQNVRSVQKIENGQREPRLFLALQLVEAAGAEPGAFFAALSDALTAEE